MLLKVITMLIMKSHAHYISQILKIATIIFILKWIDLDCCQGNVINVPEDYSTIQAAIDIAVSFDTVLVADGTYIGNNNKNLNYLGKSIILMSEHGSDRCIIDCEQSGRGFNFSNGELTSAILEGFTIRNGSTNQGSGILCNSGSSPTIRNCSIIANSATNDNSKGGGICCLFNSNPLISNCMISYNFAFNGSAVYSGVSSSLTLMSCIIEENWINQASGSCTCQDGGSLVLIDSTLNNNHGHIYSGGVIFSQNGLVRVEHCTITNNQASGVLMFNSSLIVNDTLFYRNLTTGDGGCIYVFGNGSTLIDNCFLSDNEAVRNAGGIYIASESTITNCILINNTSGLRGGAIRTNDNTSILLDNCAIIGNSAIEGGGVCVYYNGTNISNCTITNNTAEVGGGFYGTYSYSCAIINSIFASNHSEIGSEIALINPGSNPSNLSITYSTIMNGWEGIYIDPGCFLNWGEGMIEDDPLFVSGPMGDFYLCQIFSGQESDSPCLDAGSDLAELVCYQDYCMDDYTTRTDHIPDTGQVDMGYHYPLHTCTSTPVASPTRNPSPVVSPTISPTSTKISSPTPSLTSTTTPASSPTPTIILGVRLWMPATFFSPGDPCGLQAQLFNFYNPQVALLFVVLDINGQYWFWDDWSQEMDFVALRIFIGVTELTIIPEFTWPDTGMCSLVGLRFWGAMTNEEMTVVLGDSEGIGLWNFGYGP